MKEREKCHLQIKEELHGLIGEVLRYPHQQTSLWERPWVPLGVTSDLPVTTALRGSWVIRKPTPESHAANG